MGRTIREILADDWNITPVEINGGTVYVRSISAKDRLSMSENDENTDKLKWIYELLVRTVCDKSGKLVFTLNDIDFFSERNMKSTLEPLIDAALSINGMKADSVEDQKKISKKTD